MFKDGLPLEDVAIELDLEIPTILCYYQDYLQLVNMGRLVTICKELKDDFSLFLRLYGRIKKEGLSKPQLEILLKTPKLLWIRRGKWTPIIITYGICTQKKCRWKRNWRKRKKPIFG